MLHYCRSRHGKQSARRTETEISHHDDNKSIQLLLLLVLAWCCCCCRFHRRRSKQINCHYIYWWLFNKQPVHWFKQNVSLAGSWGVVEKIFGPPDIVTPKSKALMFWYANFFSHVFVFVYCSHYNPYLYKKTIKTIVAFSWNVCVLVDSDLDR